MKEAWYPFLVMHGDRRIGVYWGADAKFAADSARMESRSFGPVDLTKKRLSVTPFTEADRVALAKSLGVAA